MLLMLLWQQGHWGSPPDPTAISGFPRRMATRLGASAPAAPSPSFLSQQPTVTLGGSPPDQTAISGLPRRLATRLDASAPAAPLPNFLSQHSASYTGSQPDPMAISGSRSSMG